MKTKIKNISRVSFVVVLFFALIQIGQVGVALASSFTAQDMINLTNKSRTEVGLVPLAVNEKLTEAAQKKADDMFQFQYFAHNSPSGKTPWDFIKSTGYNYLYAGENLAIDFVTAKGAHKALMDSSSHRANILNKKYKEIGIAVKEAVFEGDMSILIVEEFGDPLVKIVKEERVNYNQTKNVVVVVKNKVNKTSNLKNNNKKEKSKEVVAPVQNPTLITKNQGNEKVLGLVNKVYTKNGHTTKKYNFQQNQVELTTNRYSQNEFLGRIFFFYSIMAILLVFDFVFILYVVETRHCLVSTEIIPSNSHLHPAV